MGSMMSLLFAENGLEVSMYDPSPKNLDSAMSNAKTAKPESKITPYSDYKPFCESIGSEGPKLFLLSVPHGTVGDGIVESLDPYLIKGDIIVDASNEWFANTQRRQGKMTARGVHYVGTGVSGGYQSARAGPSMSPSGDEAALKQVMPLFEKIAAKDSTRNNAPCVAMIGPGGSGHYVKMVRPIIAANTGGAKLTKITDTQRHRARHDVDAVRSLGCVTLERWHGIRGHRRGLGAVEPRRTIEEQLPHQYRN